MVSGIYVAKLADASHVLFEGHLDNPAFRSIAIQRIQKLEGGTVTLERSGVLAIKTLRGRERVKVSFVCPIFGKWEATGHPFKDDNTPAITDND